MPEILQLTEKAFLFAKNDSFYLLPVIGSIQLLIIGIFYKKYKFIYISLILLMFFSAVFPLVKLIPNLGTDAFSEFQKINFEEVIFYIKTLNFFAGWSKKHFILWSVILCSYTFLIYLISVLSKKFTILNFLNINYLIIAIIIVIPTSLNFYKVSLLYNSSVVEKMNQEKNIIYDLDNLEIRFDDEKKLSIVFYIGEATSRLHWSLYDYFRETNKKLKSFGETNSLILFNNIYSTHTHTSPSLLDALTIKAESNDQNDLKIPSEYLRYTIVDILDKASIKTNLYSTQAKSGSWNLASSLIFKNASNKKYSFKYNLGNASYINKNSVYDHEFLKEFTNSIEKKDSLKNNFYVFHSYAGHGNYKKNVPSKYHKRIDDYYSKQNNRAIFGKKFKNNQKEFLENYDSAMNYISDNIVFTLDEISKLDKPIIFIYTSDHGESPLTGNGHDSSRYIWEMSSVPFLIYFNEKAKTEYNDLFNEIKFRSDHNNREILSNLPSLILELFGIKILNLSSELHYASKCKFGYDNCFDDFHIIRNQLDTLGVVNLKYPPKMKSNFIDNTDRATTFSNMKDYILKKGSSSKICSHRTNSIARFIRFNAILNCMEIDIFIKDDYLEVTHSFDKSTSLRLEDLIKIQKDKENTLWLDIKNIENPLQCENLNTNLRNMILMYNNINLFIELPSQIINEISLYKECIYKIKSMNFPVSYYIPNNLKSKCLEEDNFKNINSNKCEFSENLLEKIYKSNLFTDLSFDYENYEIIKNSNYIDKFVLNTWHIPDEDIVSVSENNFRLLLPFNDNINFN